MANNNWLTPGIHDSCSCEIQVNGPHIGLYCKPHKHWLKWLTKEELKICIDSGIKLATTPTRDKLALKDNHTIKKRIKKRIKRNKRWLKYKKANRGVKTAPTRML
jgi:hypothetical protein